MGTPGCHRLALFYDEHHLNSEKAQKEIVPVADYTPQAFENEKSPIDSEESGGGGAPPDSLEIPDLVRYSDHQDPQEHDPANLDKIGGNFLHHPAVMGSLEKLISKTMHCNVEGVIASSFGELTKFG
eukprot:NP_001033558.1 Uncharacterized protein CELE_T06F4.3 [Caenorhabditis elegans]